jgi:DNA replication and repair protein RecF
VSLTRLMIQNLRNLQAVDIYPSEQVNLFSGLNGSGKTSILEAISILGLGRSFRTHKHKPLIRYEQSSYTLFGQVKNGAAQIPLGVNRQLNGEVSFKAHGSVVSSAAALAGYLPLQIFNADSFQLLDGSPKERRQFIDWLVFHVEPNFFQVWKDHQLCLKHRNSLLRRDRIDSFELESWDQELIGFTERLTDFRKSSLDGFNKTFAELSQEFLGLEGLQLSFYQGWDKGLSYAQALAGAYEGDRNQGFTRLGGHRADLKITLNGLDAADVLSRGQQKLLVTALKIAQGLLFSQLTERKCIYLIDDLPAELDKDHRALLVHWLDTMKTQVFITGVDQHSLIEAWEKTTNVNIKLFHVEQGRVIQQPDH